VLSSHLENNEGDPARHHHGNCCRPFKEEDKAIGFHLCLAFIQRSGTVVVYDTQCTVETLKHDIIMSNTPSTKNVH
jgi:hypothetical protein